MFTKYTNTNNQTNKMDNVKNYFKSGNNNSASNINIISNLNNNKQAQNNHSNNMENTFGNSITMENSNINIGNSMNNNIQGLFKTTNKGSSNIITPISIHTNVSTNILNQEREKKEKENAEQNEKLKASNIEMKADNPNKNAQDNGKLIKFIYINEFFCFPFQDMPIIKILISFSTLQSINNFCNITYL